MDAVKLKAMLNTFSQMLTAQSIFGKPVTHAGKTIIPVCAIGFGFGSGKDIGGGGGGGVLPVALIIIDKNDVRIEPLGPAGVLIDNLIERLFEGVKSIVEKKGKKSA